MTDPGTAPAASPAPGGAGGTKLLSRELATFLVEFSIALHKNQIYPAGHPLLDTAVAGFTERLHELLEARTTLSLGVARHQLVIEGVATDPANPLLRELALKLHRHHLGAIKFTQGLEYPEVAQFLKALAIDPHLSGEALGRSDGDEARRWLNIWLFPLAYEQLELIEDDRPTAGDGEGRPEAAGRSTQLWVGLATAALAGQTGDHVPAPAAADPGDVARAIDEHARETTYDQVVVGYLLQIADELKVNPQPAGTGLQRRVSRLVSTLRPDTLRRLLEMGGDAVQRRRFVLDASQGMAVSAVVELVKAAADTSHQNISHSLVRMLSKLAAHAEAGAPDVRKEADLALRDNVRQLLTGWELDNPNPEQYTSVLEAMAKHQALRGASMPEQECEPSRVVAMAVEVDVLGESVRRAVDAMNERGEFPELLDILERAPRTTDTVATLWEYIATPERLRELLERPEIPFDLVDRLALRIGAPAAEPMLEAYGAAEARGVRRKLHDRLAQLGPGIGPQVVLRLVDTPWYVQRNMLALLGTMPVWPDGFSPEPFVRHDDARVRREAYRLLFRVVDQRDAAVNAAIADPDDAVLRLGLTAALEGLPGAAQPRVTAVAVDPARPAAVRALAIRALGAVRAAGTLPFLLEHAMARHALFRRDRLAARSPEMLAALTALATFWADHPDAAAALALAGRSDDPEVQAAIRRKGSR
ncbi:MAG TPA: hypothetical protein VFI39_00740 [Gemmatimonadales bacterium]|nr:hypothetical protein [Gemmatimonadales bacterium]